MTETQIAKENIKFMNECKEENTSIPAGTHKQSCERFLDFLEKKMIEVDKMENELTSGFGQNEFNVDLNLKITDLRNAIKSYEDNEN